MQTQKRELEQDPQNLTAALKDDKEEKDPTTLELFIEFWKIFIPAFITNITQRRELINLLFISSFNDTEKMAGLGLAISILAVIMVIMNGITIPVETLTSNAFGSGNLKLCGLYLNRSLMVALGTYSIIAALFYFLFLKQQIFSSLEQDRMVV